MRFKTVFATAISLGLSIEANGASPTPVELTMTPTRAEIGVFYGGVELTVAAEVDPNVELALLVTDSPSDIHLRKKGRIWGLFWAPTDDIIFSGIPNLYLLQTSTEVDALAPERILRELGLGYETLRHPRGEEGEDELFQELIHLKESEGLFSLSSETAEIESQPSGKTERTSIAVLIPANAPATTYSVQLFGFRDGQLVVKGEGNFELRQSKIIALITSLAQEHGLLYGLIAVLIALAAGLGVGFLFGSAGKH